MHMNDPSKSNPSDAAADQQASFAETAMRLGGKSDDEARRTGAIDKADDQVEQLFQPQYQTINSPAHRAVWDRGLPIELFQGQPLAATPDIQKVMDDSIDVVRQHRSAGTLYDEQGKITEPVMEDLGTAGYWGLLVDREYGGSGTPFRVFAPFLTRMAIARSDDRRFGERPRLHWSRRSRPHIWRCRAETAIPAGSGQWSPLVGLCPDRAWCGIRFDGAADHGRIEGRQLRRQRREAVHHQCRFLAARSGSSA